jgi:outer membrane protein OmpA-like peptidoglycan-associated protein
MNLFGASRFGLREIFISIFLCTGSAFCAEELKPTALDLIYKALDLKYASEDLGGGGQQLKSKEEGTTGASSALKSQVLDLVASGADIQESATEIKISLQGEILFDFDKADIRAAAEPTLAQVAKMIQSYSKARVLIEGHTDSKGSDSYNAKLSDRRAVSVKTWFARRGLNAGAMQTQGWGAAKPVAPNKHPDGSDDPGGRQKNRRVEITIKK